MMFDDVLLDRTAVERDEVKAAQDRIMRIAAARLAPDELADIQRRRAAGLPFLDLAPADIMPLSVFQSWADLAQPPEDDDEPDTEADESDTEHDTQRPKLDIPDWLL
jgi:hypothetical protein